MKSKPRTKSPPHGEIKKYSQQGKQEPIDVSTNKTTIVNDTHRSHQKQKNILQSLFTELSNDTIERKRKAATQPLKPLPPEVILSNDLYLTVMISIIIIFPKKIKNRKEKWKQFIRNILFILMNLSIILILESIRKFV